ncbi:uncharacterized protein BO96DRAFT_438593 [Aspergillus niger CBS 101883]|uniref:Contig An18c0160, genomic contig n=2 Tax=Aspergillus niger TaxID=5061 RepID=A2RAY9_ASPNC|nr:uncharacterized protein BO96DRAFT_438593 [Aspergillus niger CBS 101883]XP_059602956.1 uncharacterized protein An18g04830 [Aspergillus niger]PYH51740.1 hypothetical protein BO96DRAFT_438593 [Aspergillus niger CBS 101883]CAK43285.1 unnamed protein product [Aspergillus niger]
MVFTRSQCHPELIAKVAENSISGYIIPILSALFPLNYPYSVVVPTSLQRDIVLPESRHFNSGLVTATVKITQYISRLRESVELVALGYILGWHVGDGDLAIWMMAPGKFVIHLRKTQHEPKL